MLNLLVDYFYKSLCLFILYRNISPKNAVLCAVPDGVTTGQMIILFFSFLRGIKMSTLATSSAIPTSANTNLRRDGIATNALNSEAINDNNNNNQSAVSWSAVIAGTVTAAILALALMMRGLGLGLSEVSVWSNEGISASKLGFSAIIWLALTNIIANGMGGYLAGRLRTKWVSVHTDEVFFRVTAHGFLSWALASILSVTLLTSVASSIIGATAKSSASLLGGASEMTAIAGAGSMNATNETSKGALNYVISGLFRNENNNSVASNTTPETSATTAGASADTDKLGSQPSPQNSDTPSSSAGNVANSQLTSNGSNPITEVMSIFTHNMNSNVLPPKDLHYIASLVAQKTGVSQAEAETRVASTFSSLQEQKSRAIVEAKELAEQARKTAANTELWFFVLLLMGAFSASLAATWGGKCRDN